MSEARDWTAHVEALHAAAALRAERALPPEVARHARLLLLDTIGCALAGRLASEVARLESLLAGMEPGAIRLAGGPGLGVRAAAQVLAAGATWHEACEGHAFAHGRPGVATIAALLPLALQRGATLGELLCALVTGYEVGARAGGWLRIPPGFHVDANWPALGVAAGVARLLQLPAPQARHAVDIAACQLASSLYLPIRTGRNVRNVYLAHSALAGIDAAVDARAGIEAPPDALAWYAEHACPAAQDAPVPADADLVLDAYLKPFAAVRHVHYGALAARRIRERLADTTGVTAIELAVYDEARVYCNNPQPRTLLAAQFSLTFGVAAMLRFGVLDASSYAPAAFDDAELRRLERLVQVRTDAELTAHHRRGATLRVTANGTTLQERVGPGPEPDLVLDAQGVIAKFEHSALPSVAREHSAAFAAALLEIAPERPFADVWQLLRADGAHPTGSH